MTQLEHQDLPSDQALPIRHAAREQSSGRSVGSRRRAVSVLAGVLVGVGLGFVLVRGPGGGGSSAGPTATAQASSYVAPGVSAASANLLGLDVLPTAPSLVAPNFHLVDQRGQATTLSAFRGKVVVWSLNDDRCTDLCRLFAEDVVAADRDLGKASADVEFVSVNANPYYPTPADVRAWSVQNDLEDLPNWTYVTGSPAQLRATWAAYHVTVLLDPKDRTVQHDATVEYISPTGRLRAIGDFTEGAISTAYYAHGMAQMADDLLPPEQRSRVAGTGIASPTTRGATIGDAAPTFELPELGTGKTTSLSAFEAKPIVLNFWASTCTICVQEMPALQQVDASMGGKVAFVGVDVADPRAAAAAFARRLGVRYPLLDDADGTVAAAYRVSSLPVTFIIAPRGAILARHEAGLTYAELMAVLEMDVQGLP